MTDLNISSRIASSALVFVERPTPVVYLADVYCLEQDAGGDATCKTYIIRTIYTSRAAPSYATFKLLYAPMHFRIEDDSLLIIAHEGVVEDLR